MRLFLGLKDFYGVVVVQLDVEGWDLRQTEFRKITRTVPLINFLISPMSCVLVHIFFKYIKILKSQSRLPFSKYLKNKVLVGKEKFVERTFNKYAGKLHFKNFETEVKDLTINFRSHAMPLKGPDGKFLRLAFIEIGYAFLRSDYFNELRKLRKNVLTFILDP